MFRVYGKSEMCGMLISPFNDDKDIIGNVTKSLKLGTQNFQPYPYCQKPVEDRYKQFHIVQQPSQSLEN